MNLQMDVSLAKGYKSPSQVAKLLTENWIAQESYCPSCLNTLTQAKANSRVLDFTCKGCEFDFELKSKKGIFSKKITDGAYGAMIERLAQPSSPHFFFMNYSPDFKVQNLIAVPAYFIQPSVIERRNPLSQSAKRAGWVGCNILSEKIPEAGKIVLIKNSVMIDRESVKKKWSQTSFLRAAENIDSRSWMLDVLRG
jgi:type II restriction enzyme